MSDDKPVWEQDEYEPEPMTYEIDYLPYGQRRIKHARHVWEDYFEGGGRQ